jgi:hypothetical protein
MEREMPRRRRRFALKLALAVIAACPASPAASLAKPPEAAADRIKLFEWFSTLGFPDVQHARFVRYPLSLDQPEGAPVRVLFAHGFLLRESKSKWTILAFDLKPQQIVKNTWYNPRPANWECQADDLAAFANATLARQAKPESDERSDFDGWGHSKTSCLFFLAWACWRQGLDGPAARLFELVTDLPDRQLGLPPGRVTLQRRLAADLAHEEFVEAQFGLARDENPRERILARVESIPKKFPGVDSAFRAQEMARVLRLMVQEDRQHAQEEKLKRPFAERPRKEQIAELIFQLRDQSGESMDQPADHADIFGGDPPNGPAGRLFKMGYEAVPQLIEALSDERCSRAVTSRSGRNAPRLAFRYHVLTVGNCALQILERLACRKFCKRTDRFMSESPTLIAAVKKAALQWNDELQRELKQKGERQFRPSPPT